MNPSDLISISEAARQHGAGRATIYRAIDDGRLNAAEVAGRTLVVRDEKWDQFEPEKAGTRHPNYGSSSD